MWIRLEGEGEQLVDGGCCFPGPNKSGKGARQASSEVDRRGKNLRKFATGARRCRRWGGTLWNAVHAKVDLVRLEVALLRSTGCKKSGQRELAYLRETAHGKRAEPADGEPTQIIFACRARKGRASEYVKTQRKVVAAKKMTQNCISPLPRAEDARPRRGFIITYMNAWRAWDWD